MQEIQCAHVRARSDKLGEYASCLRRADTRTAIGFGGAGVVVLFDSIRKLMRCLFQYMVPPVC
jgi:hypothetical protein